MLRISLLLLMWLLPFLGMAQTTPLDITSTTLPVPYSTGYITAVCEDTLSNRLFAAWYDSPGPSFWGIHKMNLSSGSITSILNFSSITNGIPRPTQKILYRNHKLYFNRSLPGQSREQLVCTDTTGSVLWSYTFTANSDSLFDMEFSITGDTLIVGGSFLEVSINKESLIAFNANTGQLLTTWLVTLGGTGDIIVRDILVQANKMYVAGAFVINSCSNLAEFNLTPTGPIHNNSWQANTNGEVFGIISYSSSLMIAVGQFTTPRTSFFYLNKTSGAPFTFGPTYTYPLRQIAIYPNGSPNPSIFVAGDFTGIIAVVSYSSSSSVAPWASGITPYNSRIKLNRFRNRLYVSSAKQNANAGPYKVYCFAPPIPGNVSFSSTAFCRAGNPIIASVQPVQYATSYNWSYNGTGLTITGNSSSVQLQFGLVATSGTLTVTAQSNCGLNSTQRQVAINLLPSPTVNAGPNDSLTCLNTSVLLDGSSTTPGTSLLWTFPSSLQFPDSTLTTDPGQYILTATAPNQCIWRDTMQVIIDTIRPALQPFGFVPDLTCSSDSVVLDAATVYPTDSLRWTTLQGVFPNPFAATVSGNYLLTIHNRRNGCENSDTIFVNENIAPPPVLLPASIDTLTCLQTSVQLNSPPITGGVQVWNLVGDTVFVNNPATVSVPGNYILTTTSLINGCVSQGVVNVNQFITPPNVTVPANVPVLNCSFDSVTINGSSANIGAGLWWTGPGSFSSADPAIVSQPGVYVLTVTHPQNGCTRSDSVTVNYVNTLTVIANADTTICPGSGAVLTAAPVGGTPGFSIGWDNNGGSGSPVTVYPADSLTYIVTITDNAGCVGTDTVRVNVPDVLSDSTLSFQPCDPLQPTGQVQVYAWGGVPPYQFSIDGGSTYQNSGVFANLGYGNYSFIIRDTLGCTRATSAVIDTNSLSPAPDFLLSTNPDMGDTVVIVDISNPRPDSVHWIFPQSVTVIDSNQFAPVILYGDTGTFSITMQAYYGTCEVNYVRNIIIGPFVPGGATPWNNNGIDTLIVYPNPNNGTFTIDLELHAEQTFLIQVFDANGIERFRMPPITADDWNGSITIPAALPGNYQLRVTAEYDSESRVIIVTQ